MSGSTYPVTGMTCGDCGDSVAEEIGTITGVRKVDVHIGYEPAAT
jgi:copper chaperone CopZ